MKFIECDSGFLVNLNFVRTIHVCGNETDSNWALVCALEFDDLRVIREYARQECARDDFESLITDLFKNRLDFWAPHHASAQLDEWHTNMLNNRSANEQAATDSK